MIKIKSSYVVGTMIERFVARSVMTAITLGAIIFCGWGFNYLLVYYEDFLKLGMAIGCALILFGFSLASCAPSASEQRHDPNAQDQD